MLLKICYPDPTVIESSYQTLNCDIFSGVPCKNISFFIEIFRDALNVSTPLSVTDGLYSKEICPLFFCSFLLMEHFKRNYSGPVFDDDFQLFTKAVDINMINESCINAYLSIDGEFLSKYHINSPYFLTIASCIINHYQYLHSDSSSVEIKLIYLILSLRACFLQQKLMPPTCPSSHKKKILSLCSDLIALIKSNSFDGFDMILVLFEILSVYLYFRMEVPAQEILEMISSYTGLTFSWTGIRGRRLVHQKETFMHLSIILSGDKCKFESLTSKYSTRGITVPENISFTKSGDEDKYLETVELDSNPLLSVDQLGPGSILNHFSYFEIFVKNAFILAQFELLRISLPDSSIRTEELSTIIDFIISGYTSDDELKSKINWTLFSTALALRSIWVESNSRKAVRSCLQMEALISQTKNFGKNEYIADRLTLAWCVPGILSFVEMQNVYGSLMNKLGAPLSAYDVYYRLGDMTSAIKCLVAASEHKKALDELLALLKENIPISERLPLLCLLGDLKGGDIVAYQQAWELSNHKYAAAQRSIGFLLQSQNNFVGAIDAFNLSLKINPNFSSVWSSLACCYIKTGDYDPALSAFRRALGTIENDNTVDGSIDISISEIWSNIALIYHVQGYSHEAFSAIQEAIKKKYDDSQLWDNYLTLALRVGKEPSQVLLAISRLNELKPGSVDWKIFDVIWNSFKPTSSGDVQKDILRYLDWMNIIEPTFASDASYWTRRALMISKLPVLLLTQPVIDLKLTEWDCWMKAYQVISSISYSTNENTDAVVSLLENMFKCTNINTYQFSTMLRTTTARIKKAMVLPDDQEINLFLRRLENLNLK